MEVFVVCLILVISGVTGLIDDDTSTTSDLLFPQPTQMTFGTAVYSIDPTTFSFQTDQNGVLLHTVIDRYAIIIFQSPAPFYLSGDTPSSTLQGLKIVVNSDNETLDSDTNESYELSVNGTMGLLTCETVYGAMKGLETFSQLVYHISNGGFAINEVTSIVDKPRFSYRGIMIDTSRHFLNMKTILQNLDAMSYNKYNILHWHIVDDQSFPYQSIKFPEMTAKGAYDKEHIYTQSDVQEVISYARERGIRVIPEFDTPGHTRSWGNGQPNLLTPCYDNNNKSTGEYGPINPILDSTWDFLNEFYKEIDAVFPDKYIHLGGDEVSFNCWQSNPDIKKWMESHGYTDYSKLEEYYENNLIDLVNKLQKSYVVWQEIFDNGLKIKMDTIIDVWKGNNWQKEMADITSAGYDVILSACWYLNYISYGSDWINYYKCDPQDFNGTDAQNSKVIGGHACLWGELVDSTNFISRMWPRASAVAERLWSPKTLTDVQSASIRITNQRCRLLSRGIRAQPVNGPSYCNTEWEGP